MKKHSYIYEDEIFQYYNEYINNRFGFPSEVPKNPLTPKDISVVPVTPPTPKGMKDWYIDGYHVQAVTKKSAIKKVNKLHNAYENLKKKVKI